jgi:uncharacterized protein involved in response to NO
MHVRLEDPVVRRPPTAPTTQWALFALGFRPFYLLAALLAATAIPLWVLVFMGKLTLPLPGIWWHAHEMLFGFAAAVIVGFLFTAGRNWTGLPTPTGKALAALAGLWLAGRLTMLLGDGAWVAVVDSAFLPVVAVVLARLLWRTNQSRHNYFVPLLISALALTNICFHLARLNFLEVDPLRCLHAALMLIVLLETVIAGRVTPGFTASTIRGVRQWRPVWLDIATIVLTGLAFVAWLLRLPVGLAVALALTAASAHLVRAFGWNPWAARREPMLWILHVSYLWIPVGLLLLMAQQMNWVPLSAPMHAFGIGATGGLIIGMITRTALGHTGRTLKVGAGETAAYVLVPLAALVRVGTLVFLPALAMMGIHIAASLWALAFVIYLWRYAPWLARPRLDGQPG